MTDGSEGRQTALAIEVIDATDGIVKPATQEIHRLQRMIQSAMLHLGSRNQASMHAI